MSAGRLSKVWTNPRNDITAMPPSKYNVLEAVGVSLGDPGEKENQLCQSPGFDTTQNTKVVLGLGGRPTRARTVLQEACPSGQTRFGQIPVHDLIN